MGGRARVAAVGLALCAGCLDLEYSPHAVTLDGDERDLHRKALARLEAGPAPEVLRVGLVGDTQLLFDQAQDLVGALNRRDDLAFVVQLGDFTHFGTLPEFRAMNRIFARLRVPYFVVIGIHELLGNGGEIYRRMFGEPDAAFTLGRTRFIMFDSNSREAGFDGTVPDLGGLRDRLEPDGTFDRVVLMSHVAPATEDFDPGLDEAYAGLLRSVPSVVSFHAHEHRARDGEVAGTPLWVADSVDGRTYLVLTVGPGGLEVERVPF